MTAFSFQTFSTFNLNSITVGEFLFHYSLFARKFYESPNRIKPPWNKESKKTVEENYLCVFIFRVIRWLFVICKAKTH